MVLYKWVKDTMKAILALTYTLLYSKANLKNKQKKPHFAFVVC